MRLPLVQRVTVVVGGGTFLGVVAFMATAVVAWSSPPPPTVPTAPPVAPSTTAATVAATATPSSVATVASRERIVIHGVGDVNTDSTYHPALAAEGHEFAWSGLGSLFTGDDLTVANLECTPSQLGTPLDKEFVFRCDPSSLEVMAEAGVDVVSLANNHSRDHGAAALLDGIGQLGAAGLTPVGAGEDVDAASRPALVEVGGWKVAVLGFGGVVPTPDWIAADDHPGMADGDSIESMAAAVEAADDAADLVVVTIHWGAERDTRPRPEDRARAEALIRAGADVVFGHHAHRLQPLETVEDVPVAWGLGNFVWPAVSPEAAATAVARVVVEPDGTVEACLIPAEISSQGRPELIAGPPC